MTDSIGDDRPVSTTDLGPTGNAEEMLKELLLKPSADRDKLFKDQNDLSELVAKIKNGKTTTARSDVSKALSGSSVISTAAQEAINLAVLARLEEKQWSETDKKALVEQVAALIRKLQHRLIDRAGNAADYTEEVRGNRWAIWPHYARPNTARLITAFKLIPYYIGQEITPRFTLCFRTSGTALSTVAGIIIAMAGQSESGGGDIGTGFKDDIDDAFRRFIDWESEEKFCCYLVPASWTISPVVLVNPEIQEKITGQHVYFTNDQAVRCSIPHPYILDFHDRYIEFEELENTASESEFTENIKESKPCKHKISFQGQKDKILGAVELLMEQRSVISKYRY